MKNKKLDELVVPKNLVIKDGCHIIRIDAFNDHLGTPTCRISCIDDDSTTIDLNGEWVDEYSEGNFYPNSKQIDEVIDKLNEAKVFLNKKVL